MKLGRDTAELFIPDGLDAARGLVRTTHLAVGAHPDDLEIMAIDGILQCFRRADRWFAGVVVTGGAESPRGGRYRDYSNAEMRALRAQEQKTAAVVGEYGALALLDYPSAAVKDPSNNAPTDDIRALLAATGPTVAYTHSLTDRHDTHVAVALRVVEAARRLPAAQRPQRLYGCEVWRDLDWLVDADRVAFDCSAHENVQTALLGVFDSQISGGKRYDLAAMGRRRAHATYQALHETDVAAGVALAMDLTPLIRDLTMDVRRFVRGFLARFEEDVLARLARFEGGVYDADHG